MRLTDNPIMRTQDDNDRAALNEVRYARAVSLCLESNNDQRDFDTASAMAAVDSMLDEENGNIESVLNRLIGDMP